MRWIAAITLILGRSLFPFLSFAILAGTLFWGPWASLFLALCAWRLVVRYA